MPEDSQICPVCNSVVEPGAATCSSCGYSFAEKTQAFTPLAAEQAEVTMGVPPTDTPVLEVADGMYKGEQFVLGQGTFTIGRDPKCDIFLNNTTVSRYHASIVIENDTVQIVDAGSLNGTWVDGAVVEDAYLHAGSRINIGTFSMVFKYKKS
ncbi:MAG: FHA domain-containing protein [Coriobacteriaceae bacterium]|nr:FHA domain-containing protein [Coriobacteriaceae bacterium]